MTEVLFIVIMAIIIGAVVVVVEVPVLAVGYFVLGLFGHTAGASRERPGRVRPPLPLALRTAVLDRDQWQCVYCGSKEDLQIDHIIPVSRGGATVFGNLETLCEPCNERKGAM